MTDALIPLLAFVSVLGLGGAVVLVQKLRRKVLENRLQGVGYVTSSMVEPPPLPGSSRLRFGILSSLVGSIKPSARLQDELVRAGYHGPEVAKLYLGMKTALLMVGATLAMTIVLGTGMSAMRGLLLIMVSAGVLYFVPNVVVRARAHKRAMEVRLHLPDALDLLEICVSSGMGIDAAWNAVTDELRGVCPILSDEMALTNLEIHLGANRAEAMRHMATRTGGQDISSLVAVMVQSDRFGTSMAQALQTFAASMRQGRSQRAEERAEKMAVKLVLPMVLFIFPAVMIVLVGPAGLTLSKIFGGL